MSHSSDTDIENQVREEVYYHDTVYRFCRLLEEAYMSGSEEGVEEWSILMEALRKNLPREIVEEVFGSDGFDRKREALHVD